MISSLLLQENIHPLVRLTNEVRQTVGVETSDNDPQFALDRAAHLRRLKRAVSISKEVSRKLVARGCFASLTGVGSVPRIQSGRGFATLG